MDNVVKQAVTVTVDDEFRGLIPPLSKAEYSGLEAKLLAEGCTERLKVWRHGGQDVLIDGHNRYDICQKHGIPFEVEPVELKDRDAVKRWMVENQLGRRNANSFVKVELAAKLLGWSPEKAAANRQGNLKQAKSTEVPNGTSGKQDITQEVADVAGVSRRTAARVLYVLSHGGDEVIAQCRAVDLSVSAAYQVVRDAKQLADKNNEELKDLIPVWLTVERLIGGKDYGSNPDDWIADWGVLAAAYNQWEKEGEEEQPFKLVGFTDEIRRDVAFFGGHGLLDKKDCEAAIEAVGIVEKAVGNDYFTNGWELRGLESGRITEADLARYGDLRHGLEAFVKVGDRFWAYVRYKDMLDGGS